MILIEAKDLRAGYGSEEILHGLTFTVSAGERLCITGPNGCGKTTLLRVLAGTLPYKGSLSITVTDPESRLFGATVERRTLTSRAGARETALLTQLSEPAFPFTVAETVMLGRYARQKPAFLSEPAAADRAECEAAMKACGVSDIAEKSVDILSGGQLQRTLLARNLAQNPAVLLLDEPTNHLDLRYQLELLSVIDSWLTETASRAAVGVFHDLPLALRFAKTMLLLDGGKIAAYGPAREIAHGKEISDVYGMDVGTVMRSLLGNW